MAETDLEAFDKYARRKLASAKRAMRIAVRGSKVYVRVELRGFISADLIDHIRAVINIAAHGKAYAPEHPTDAVSKLHHVIGCGLGFTIPLVFDMADGSINVDPEPRATWGY